MGKQPKSLQQRVALAKAVVSVLSNFGMVYGDFLKLKEEEWSKEILGILPKLDMFSGTEERSKDARRRTARNILQARFWPGDDSLNGLVDDVFVLKKRINIPISNQFSDFDQLTPKEEVKKNLLNYKDYLEVTKKDFLPFSEWLKKTPPNDNSNSILSIVKEYIINNQEFMYRFMNHLDGNFRDTFIHYNESLDNAMASAEKLIEQGEFNLEKWKLWIRKDSFTTERKLLDISLSNDKQNKIYFSDAGLSEEKKPVWSEDQQRLDILSSLKYAKIKNRKNQFKRVLILDGLNPNDHPSNILKYLAQDTHCLLDHGVDVILSTKKIAKDLKDEYYNYAICDNGILMKADNEHTHWRIAKVPKSHEEFKNIMKNYKRLENEAGPRTPTFLAKDYESAKNFTVDKIKEDLIKKLEHFG